MKTEKLVIGSRGSDLAFWQSNRVKSVLTKAHPYLDVVIRVIKTQGDIVLDKPLPMLGGKGVFTKEIEEQLLAGEIDLAVHSCKDLPTELPEGLAIGAVLRRDNPFDVLMTRDGKDLDELPEGAVVATGSLRRTAQMLINRPDISTVDVRGNVPTRLTKFFESDWDGMILARAGLERLGLLDERWKVLSPGVMLPAVAQAAVAVEIRGDDDRLKKILVKINDDNTLTAVTAERNLLATLEGGCQVPVGAYAVVDGNYISMEAQVSDLAGKRAVRDSIEGRADSASTLGKKLAERLIDSGAGEILSEIREGKSQVC